MYGVRLRKDISVFSVLGEHNAFLHENRKWAIINSSKILLMKIYKCLESNILVKN
jgi:hypothetical protein